MPSWRTALAVGGLLCLTATRGLCQSLPDRQIADFTRLAKEHPASSLAHYRLAEVYPGTQLGCPPRTSFAKR